MTDGDVSRKIKDTGLKTGWMAVALIKVGYTVGEAVSSNFIIILVLFSTIIMITKF